jgi:hypothetical protein
MYEQDEERENELERGIDIFEIFGLLIGPARP